MFAENIFCNFITSQYLVQFYVLKKSCLRLSSHFPCSNWQDLNYCVFYRFEEAFITTRLKGAKQWLWIGLNNKLSAYFWSDNSPTNYVKWNTREPRGWSKCVEIVPYRWAAGRWNAASCFKKNGYICKKGKSFSCIAKYIIL